MTSYQPNLELRRGHDEDVVLLAIDSVPAFRRSNVELLQERREEDEDLLSSELFSEAGSLAFEKRTDAE